MTETTAQEVCQVISLNPGQFNTPDSGQIKRIYYKFRKRTPANVSGIVQILTIKR